MHEGTALSSSLSGFQAVEGFPACTANGFRFLFLLTHPSSSFFVAFFGAHWPMRPGPLFADMGRSPASRAARPRGCHDMATDTRSFRRAMSGVSPLTCRLSNPLQDCLGRPFAIPLSAALARSPLVAVLAYGVALEQFVHQGGIVARGRHAPRSNERTPPLPVRLG